MKMALSSRPARALAAAAITTAALLSAACAPTLPAADPTAAEASTGAPMPAGAPWKTYADGVSGMSAAMPGEPQVAHFIIEGTHPLEARTLAMADGNPATPDYDVTRLAPTEPGIVLTLDASVSAIAATWKRVDRQQKRTRGGMATVEMEGIFLDGPAIMSLTSLGGWIYSATVRSASGLDREAVERFFDSVRIEVPWKIVTYDDDALTVSLPAPASELPQAEHEDRATHVYSLGGPSDLTFSVSWFTLTDERLLTASVDQILEGAIDGLAQGEGNRMEKVTTLDHHGVPGREATHTTAEGITMRSRVFVLGHRGYFLSVVAKDADVVAQPIAVRFLDSIRMGAIP